MTAGLPRSPTVPLARCLDYLRALDRDRVRPAEALRMLDELRESRTDYHLELLWDEEPYSGTVHYDVLLRSEGEGSVALSLCPEGETPWPLRGVQPRRERDLLRVDHDTVDVMSAMAVIDVLRDKPQIMTHLVTQCIIRTALRDRSIVATEDEVEDAVNRFRRRRGLFRVEQTEEWLAERGMTVEGLYELLAGEAAKNRLRELIVGAAVEEHFAARGREFDNALLARIRVRDHEDARRLHGELLAGDIDFLSAAQAHFLEEHRADRGEVFVAMRREQMAPHYADAVFGAEPGDLLPPLESDGGYDVVRVLRIDPAVPNETTRESIKNRLFAGWLADQRRQATVEWFW